MSVDDKYAFYKNIKDEDSNLQTQEDRWPRPKEAFKLNKALVFVLVNMGVLVHFELIDTIQTII